MNTLKLYMRKLILIFLTLFLYKYNEAQNLSFKEVQNKYPRVRKAREEKKYLIEEILKKKIYLIL
ncbi:MAG: hypothetical protein ABDH37_09155, partial [Candidatus Hydrothermales bacterium]